MSYPFDLQIVWFLLVGTLFVGYAILDGFDLGTGMLLPFVKGDENRRVMLNAIGPVWDGNEVWLIVGGGALFAAFPDVYATVFSGLYLPLVLLLTGIIFRAIAIEFRSREESPRWRRGWDWAFSISSYVIALLLGVAMGNIVLGLPIGADREYAGGFFNLLNPYALVCGVTTVALFMMHGAIYQVMKTDGEVHNVIRGRLKGAIALFGACFVAVTIATFVFAPQMAEKMRETPALFLLPAATLLLIANIPREIARGKELLAFVSSSAGIACMLALFGLGMFPNLVPSTLDPNFSLTIRNASSSLPSLTTMFTITLIGLPFVLAYTAAIYWVFRGKVDRAHLHY